jgi:hypothetical protein
MFINFILSLLQVTVAFTQVSFPVDSLTPHQEIDGRFTLHQKNGTRTVLDCVSFIHGVQVQKNQSQEWVETEFHHLYFSECAELYKELKYELAYDQKICLFLYDDGGPRYEITDPELCSTP